MGTTKPNKEDYIIQGFGKFDSVSYKEFKEKNELGYTPYYFDDKDYTLTELKLDNSFNPLKCIKTDSGCKYKRFYSNEENPYGFIFFLKGDGIKNITKLTEKIGELIKQIDKQKKLYLKYTAAVVKKLSGK
jgi:hypothetical protein